MNPEIDSIKTGMFWKTASTGINALAGFAMSVLFARSLGEGLYGELILVYTVVSLFVLLSNFGLDAAFRRFIPLYARRDDKNRSASFIATTAVLGLSLTAVFSVVMFAAGRFIAADIFHNSALAPYMRRGVFYLFGFSILTNIICSIYHGLQKWKEECFLIGAYLFLSFFASYIVLAVLKKGIMEILTINAALCFAASAAGAFHISRCVRLEGAALKSEGSVFQIKDTLNFSAPLFMSSVLYFFTIQLDKIILGRYRPASEVAQYYVAFALATGILMFIKVSEIVLAPYLAGLTGGNMELLKRRFGALFRVFLHLSVALAISLYFFIGPFINFVYGPGFIAAAAAFKLYLVVIVLRSSTLPIGLFLINVFGKTFEITKIGILSAIAHFVLYINLIPRYGYMGAVTAAIIANIVVGLYAVLLIKEIRGLVPFGALLYAAGGIAAAFSAYSIANILYLHNPFLFLTILPMIYLSFTFFKDYMPEVKGWLQQAFSR